MIWDFSGWYETPLSARIAQNQDGGLTYTAYGYPSNYVTYDGHVTTNQGSVGFHIPVIAWYTDTVGSGYWWTCGLSARLKQDKRSLNGFREYTVMVPASLYPWLREYWYPHLVVPGINYFSDLVTVPLPDAADGRWHLDLDATSDGTRISGTASITLASSNAVPFKVSGTIPTVTKSVMKLRSPSGSSSLEMVALGPELALQSLRGTVSGQPVSYDAPAATNTLSLEILGHGAVTPLTNGQAFVIGKDYTLTARPQPGYLFSNWVVAALVVPDPKLRFTMCSNLTLRANFVPNPFLALKGSYSGLFYDTNAPAHENAGFFTLTVADKGAFSGKLQQGARRYSFSGQFDLALSAQKTVPRRRTNEVVVGLQLNGGSDHLLGLVSNAAWSSELFGYRTAFNSRSNPATNFQGAFTMLLPGAVESEDGPMGHGFSRLTVGSSGSLSFKGTLGDGSPAVQKVPLATNGQWPFYAGLYSGKGSVFGRVTLINTATDDVIGPVLWTKPGGVKGPLHPAGFTNELEPLGSRYVAPAAGTRALEFSNAVVVLEGGNLSSALTSTIVLSDRNKVTVDAPNPQKLSLALTVSSGSFKGSVVHPQTGRSATLKGVLLQKQNIGAGFFLGTNQSGRMFFGELENDLE